MKNETTIHFNEEVCTLKCSHKREVYPSKQKHTIVHVSNPFDPEEMIGSGIKEQPEHSIKGDDKELDKAWRKYNKVELLYQKQLLMHAVSHGMIEESMVRELKWSRKAGCSCGSCGCSPGWVSRDYRRQTFWLTLVSPSKEQEKKERYMEIQAKREAETLSSMVI